jgi:hypothetical protein
MRPWESLRRRARGRRRGPGGVRLPPASGQAGVGAGRRRNGIEMRRNGIEIKPEAPPARRDAPSPPASIIAMLQSLNFEFGRPSGSFGRSSHSGSFGLPWSLGSFGCSCARLVAAAWRRDRWLRHGGAPASSRHGVNFEFGRPSGSFGRSSPSGFVWLALVAWVRLVAAALIWFLPQCASRAWPACNRFK